MKTFAVVYKLWHITVAQIFEVFAFSFPLVIMDLAADKTQRAVSHFWAQLFHLSCFGALFEPVPLH